MIEKNYKTLQMWCYRFLRRYFYTIRNLTHVGQKLKDTSKQKNKNFVKNVFYLRYQTWDIYSYINIFNFDEFLVCFEMIAKTTIVNIVQEVLIQLTK